MKSDYSAGFERFWKLYPRKIGKRAAYMVWKRHVKPGLLLAVATEAEILNGLKRQIEGGQFSSDSMFIPHPRTWLHQGRWEDEITKPSTSAGLAAPEPGKYDFLE